MKDERPISHEGVSRLEPKSARLLRLDDDQVIIQIDVVGQGPLWVRDAQFISVGKETQRIEAPRRVKLKVKRSLIHFSTRRRFWMGRERFTLNPAFTLDPPPHVSLPVHFTHAEPHPLHLDPIRASLTLSSYPLETLSQYQPVSLAPPRASLAHPRCHLSPDLINLQPQFQRKAPPHD